MYGWKRVGRAALAVCLAVACVFPSYGTRTDMDDAKKKVSSLESEKMEIEHALEELKELKSNTANYVKKLDLKLKELNDEMESISARIMDKESDIEKAQTELQAAKEMETRQYESMKRRIKYMYEKGETSYIELLIKAKDFSQFLNRAEYIREISEYDRQMLYRYSETKDDVAQKEAVLLEEHAALVSLKEANQAKQESVDRLIVEKTAELENYEAKISSTQGELSELEQDIKAQEDYMKQIEAELKRKEEEAKKAAEAEGKKYNTVSIGNINFIWPSPSSSRVTSDFGSRSSPTEGASSNHQGMDIGAAYGSDIIAAAPGTVTISTYSYSAGNYIMINHGGGVSTVYMHCSQLLVTEGQQVTQGQVIGKVGSTGYSTGPHLHFGVRVNGSYVNPARYVSP